MNRQELIKQIKEKRSFLCVGLDSDIKKLPAHLLGCEDPIFEFNKAIIDATAPYTVAYKPNLAFYEAGGVKGWISFEKTVNYIKENYPEIFIIADAKRGDIGNTSSLYARSFFEEMKVDSITVAPYTVAYKPNLAFYEATGVKGWISLEKTVQYIKDNYPEIFIIADAKRGDIGNTSALYARSFFGEMKVHALTVAPYMGEDSVSPFLSYDDAWVIVLALTSNPGSHDFQLTKDENGEMLFEKVLRTSQKWGSDENMMYVVGATQGKSFENVRNIVPNHFLLVPGVGAQGGSLEEVCKYGMNDECGLLVNASRAVIFADSSENYAAVAGEKAKDYQQQMEKELKLRGVI